MNENNIISISENKVVYKLGWTIMFIFWVCYLYLGFKYVPYTFLVENPIILISFWSIILILTGILSYNFVWIFLIDIILGSEATKKRKQRSDKKCQKKNQ